MEWRCEWCGKPHEENDPPCDNCGHGKFEKAVVQQTDLSADGPESTIVWVCQECGREHPKHSPPCSRCGGGPLERQEKGVDAAELEAPGYLELLTPKYAAALGVVLLFAAIFGLGLIGVIDLPGMGTAGVPTVEDVPGNESTAGDNISLRSLESEYTDTLNDRRTEGGAEAVRRNGKLDDIATFYNQRWVKSEYGDSSIPTDRVRDLVDKECEAEPYLNRFQVPQSEYQDAEAPGQSIATARIEESPDLLSLSVEYTGIDMHAGPDGRLYVTQILC
jgi:hypothetical protein